MWSYLLFVYVIIVAGVLINGLDQYLRQEENKDKRLVPSIWLSGVFLIIAFGIYYITT